MKGDFTREILQHWRSAASQAIPGIRIFLRRFSKSLPSGKVISEAHHSVFDSFDCLQCANCCKNSSPVFSRTDIGRIASFLRLSAADFEIQYLKSDAEGDFIPREKPCPFLDEMNYCRVYEVRPRSCRSFPHTDQPEAWTRHARMAGNARACPAAFAIVEKFQKERNRN